MGNKIDSLAVEFELFKINTSRAYVLAELKRIYPLLESFVGKKIKLANGDYAKNFNVRIQSIDKFTFNGYFSTDRYISMVCITWINNPKFHSHQYASKNIKTYVSIGDMDNGVLTSLDSIEEIIQRGKLDVVLDLQTEIANIDAYLTAKKEAERLKRIINVEPDIYKYF